MTNIEKIEALQQTLAFARRCVPESIVNPGQMIDIGWNACCVQMLKNINQEMENEINKLKDELDRDVSLLSKEI